MVGMQFSLKAAFVATAFVAVAAWSVRMAFKWPEPLLLVAVPILLCGAFGVLRGRVGLWLLYGVSIVVALIALIAFRFIFQI
jgi:hypothetical protein